MKLKIVSDGTPMGTKVVNAVTGEEVEGIVSVTWRITADDVSLANIELQKLPVELIGKPK